MLDELIHEPRVACFMIGTALRNDLPTYAIGLDVLAGDTMRAATNLDLSLMVVLNDVDCLRLVMDAADSRPKLSDQSAYMNQHTRNTLTGHGESITRCSQNIPEILEWKWHYADGMLA